MKLTVRQQANRVEKWLSLADQEAARAGLVWYFEANLWAQNVASTHSTELEAVTHITSILSSQCDWPANKMNTLKFLSGDTRSIFATRAQLDECVKALTGWRIPAHRRKTSTFAETIANPGLPDKAVIDRHAIKVAFDQIAADPIKITDKRYRDAEQAFIIVAKRHNLLPSQVQAITWCTYKQLTGR